MKITKVDVISTADDGIYSISCTTDVVVSINPDSSKNYFCVSGLYNENADIETVSNLVSSAVEKWYEQQSRLDAVKIKLSSMII